MLTFILHQAFTSDGKRMYASGELYNILIYPNTQIKFHYNSFLLTMSCMERCSLLCLNALCKVVLSTWIFNSRAKMFNICLLCVRTILVILALHKWPEFDPRFSLPLQATKTGHMHGGLGTGHAKFTAYTAV